MSGKRKKTALIIFAREPKEGKVKTRLCNDLPSLLVTRIYKALVKDVLDVASNVRCDQRFIYYAGVGSSIPFLKRVGNCFQLKRQTGMDLGERMYRAFCHCKKKQFDRIVIIGTDCVTLTKRDIETALEKLMSYDCVLGPSNDGGYYLIALKYPYVRLFKGIDWGTPLVFRQTVSKIKLLEKKIFLLPMRNDIDTVRDLRKFSKNAGSTLALHTQKILKNLTY